jgi:putative membrane protein
MFGFLIRTLIVALGLWIASAIVPGMAIRGVGTLLLAALLLGVVNAVIRPIVVFLTFPITIVTLGFFLLVINGLMLALVAALLDGFHLSGLLSAIAGSVVVSITGWIASWYVGPTGRVEILVVRRTLE